MHVHAHQPVPTGTFCMRTGEQGLENLLFCAQQQPHTGAVRDWQRTCIARAVASLLGAAAVLLDVRTRATAFSRSAGIEVKPGEGGGDGEQHAPAIVRHAAEHLHLASRFLLAPWQLQIQVAFWSLPAACWQRVICAKRTC